jgi:hypothetical protein
VWRGRFLQPISHTLCRERVVSEEVFSRKQDGYLWTDVRLFGTIDDPGQDLSPRIIELFKQSPGAYLGLFFRQFEGWLKRAFGSDH